MVINQTLLKVKRNTTQAPLQRFINSCLKYLLNVKRIKTILKLFYLKKNSIKYLNR